MKHHGFLPLPADLDNEVLGFEILRKGNTRPVGVTELNITRFGFTNGCLRINVEFTDRGDPILVEFHTTWQLLLPGVEIQNPPPQRKLPATCHLGNPFVACIREPHHDFSRRSLPSLGQLQDTPGKICGGGNQFLPLGSGDHRCQGLPSGKPSEHGKPLRRPLGIRETQPRRRNLKIGKENRPGNPGSQFRGKFLLGTDIAADKPDGAIV